MKFMSAQLSMHTVLETKRVHFVECTEDTDRTGVVLLLELFSSIVSGDFPHES